MKIRAFESKDHILTVWADGHLPQRDFRGKAVDFIERKYPRYQRVYMAFEAIFKYARVEKDDLVLYEPNTKGARPVTILALNHGETTGYRQYLGRSRSKRELERHQRCQAREARDLDALFEELEKKA